MCEMGACECEEYLDFHDLVDAYFEESRHRVADAALRDYYSARLLVLGDLFGPTFEPVESAHGPRPPAAAGERDVWLDREAVADVARACLRKGTRPVDPFGEYESSEPGPLERELRDRHARAIEVSARALEQAYRAVFADALAMLFPGIDKKRVPAAALAERGVRVEKPGPWGYLDVP
jgi:hypothetical protein